MTRLTRPSSLPTTRLVAIAVVTGTSGAAALVAASAFSTVGWLIFLPYTLQVLGTAFVLQREGESRRAVRFGTILGAFMVATVLLYVYVGAVEGSGLRTIPLLGHAWRLGLMLAIGLVVSAVAVALGDDGARAQPPATLRGSSTA